MIRWLAVGIWYAAIVYTSSLTSTPETTQPWRDYLIAKAGHVFVYSLLGWILAEALTAPAAGLTLGRRTALLVTILTGAILASLDETRQSFVYGRYGQVSDVLLDTAALSAGALLHQWLTRRDSPPSPEEQTSDQNQQAAIEDQHQDLHR